MVRDDVFLRAIRAEHVDTTVSMGALDDGFHCEHLTTLRQLKKIRYKLYPQLWRQAFFLRIRRPIFISYTRLHIRVALARMDFPMQELP